MTKLLGHFLQEQQEPFALVGRGCSRGINNKSPNCSAFLKAVFGWNAFKLKGRCSSVSSSTTLFSNVRGIQCLEAEGEDFTERKKRGRGDEDHTKQLSPVSVLHQTQHSPIHPKQGDSSKSSQCKLKRLKEVVWDQHSVNMGALQQTKQLLIDCMREKLEREEAKKMEEEAWKLVCENVFIWSQDLINGSNLLHLLSYDFLASQHEWNADFEHHKKEISNELENAIFEDVINEIVIIFM